VQEQLVFLIGVMRSGSTMLARMLGAHSAIHSPAEPHLITPLAHLGYYEKVERAAYDPTITRRAALTLVPSLPRAEADYLEALRAYTDSIYAKLLASSGRALLLDKTPAYALVLDFLAKLYPKARYIVLTRNPVAVWSSYVDSFFDGDHEFAHAHNPVLERYVPAIGRFVREAPVPFVHVRYEELVQDPEGQAGRLCEHLGIEFEPGMIDYGEQSGGRTETPRGLGDPIMAGRESRPTTRSLEKWTQALEGRPDKLAQCQQILARLADDDLTSWGYPRRELEEQLAAIQGSGGAPRSLALSRHAVERRLLMRLRRNIHHNAFGRLVRSVRNACDVLLR
jgi:hypothetical protein